MTHSRNIYYLFYTMIFFRLWVYNRVRKYLPQRAHILVWDCEISCQYNVTYLNIIVCIVVPIVNLIDSYGLLQNKNL